jgi:cell wall-associated NlpC family hydrolase
LVDLSRFASRLLPARPDLAARHLEGRSGARSFVEGVRRSVTAPLLDMTATPDADAERATQLLHGEGFAVYDEKDGLAWGQALGDGYVGWVAAAGLGPPVAGDARVTALAAHLYPVPDIKRRPDAALPFLARLDLDETAEAPAGFAAVRGGGYVCRAHLAPQGGDAVDHAARFLGVPYLWGGRSAAGLDCSALVQLALAATGVAAPRDSDMQAALIGAAVPEGAPLRRGDLVFWRGHVGLVADKGLLVHANAHHMAVVREPLAEAEARIAEAGGGPVTGRRRLCPGSHAWAPPVGPA